MKEFLARDINLELKPANVYQTMISEEEIRTGQKSTRERNLPEDKIVEIPEVQAMIQERLNQLEKVCDQFFRNIIKALKRLPYGIRWICKQIRQIANQAFENAQDADILKVTGYFVYYRFINLGIVTPENFNIVEKEPSPIARKNLVAVSKVLQNLFNLNTFSKSDKWMMPMNNWIKKNLDGVTAYFNELVDVADPEDHLQVDKYMELFQKTKPVIIISLHEIANTHQHLLSNVDKIAKEKEDPLHLILNDLGEAPRVAKEDDREIQLTLTNRFKQSMEEEISATATLYAETKELIITTFRSIPVSNNPEGKEPTLEEILRSGKKYAEETGNKILLGHVTKVFDNLKTLEAEGYVSKEDNYAGFLRDIALEVANRAEIREQQRKEIKRLKATLHNLGKHQKFLKDQIKQYEDYLTECRLRHYQGKKKKKTKKGENPNKIGPFKFSYKALSKMGVIVDSDVPTALRSKTTFFISSEAVGVFDIKAKVLNQAVDVQLQLDDLLERNYNNITRLELDQIVLDVTLTIFLLNKFFLK